MRITVKGAASFRVQGQRPYQEDNRWPDSDSIAPSESTFIVCDGVGGAEHGEAASSAVAETIGSSMRQYGSDSNFGTAELGIQLGKGYAALDRTADDIGSTNMGTTLAFLHLGADGAMMAHIGDSRVYHYRPGAGFMYRSDDHSLVNSLVHTGNISPEQGVDHPRSNVITRCMSPGAANRCDATVVTATDVADGDLFFLCSDGVLHCISDTGLAEMFESPRTIEVMMERLGKACTRSSDNSTAILVRIGQVSGVADRECDDAGAGPTRLLDIPMPRAEEISPAQVRQRQSLFSRISNIFKS